MMKLIDNITIKMKNIMTAGKINEGKYETPRVDVGEIRAERGFCGSGGDEETYAGQQFPSFKHVEW